MDGTTTIKIDYYEELKAKADKYDNAKIFIDSIGVWNEVILNNRNAINPVPVISLQQFQELKEKSDKFDKLTIPLKPKAYSNGDFVCENCKTILIDEAVWGKFEYCTSCGQRLDLSNV